VAISNVESQTTQVIVPCAPVLIAGHDQHRGPWLHAHLEASGYKVLETQDPEAVLQLLARGQVDLVILGLEELRGSQERGTAPLDAFQMLRRLRLSSDVGAIVISREQDEAIKLYFLDSGADDYLVWPCNPRELLARVRAVLRRIHRSAATTSQGSRHVDGPSNV
jgi:DNA-binding response OmpR family regulator